MTDEIVSIDELMGRRKASARGDILFKAAKAPATWDAQARKGRFVMSAKSKDRDGDIVFTDGIDLTEFAKNPICLLNHRMGEPIGSWENVVKAAERMEGDVALAPPGTTPEVDKAAGLIGAGILRASSIGFIPKTVKRIVLEDGTPTWSFEIIACELVECSIVSIPSNPMALAKGAAGGPLSLARDLIEEVLDTYVKDPATGLIVPKAEFEAAHREATGNRTSIVIDGQPSKGFVSQIAEALKGMFAPAQFAVESARQKDLAEQEAVTPKPEEKAAALAAAGAARAIAEAKMARN